MNRLPDMSKTISIWTICSTSSNRGGNEMRTARQIMEGFFLALQFFTIIPIHREIPIDEKRIKFAVLSLPMIGFFIGLTGSLIMYMAKSWTTLSNWACALFLLFYFVAITGGIHLDGFTDTADAYFSFRDKEKRLKIMEDPRVGTFGVLALLFLSAFRFLFMAEIIGAIDNFWFAMFIPFFSRLIVCALMIDGPGMAKREGLGYLFAKTLAKKDFAVLIGYLLCFFIAVPMIPGLPAVYLLMALSSIFLYMYARRFFLQSFGGLTGDSFGAVIEGSETVLWMVTWLLLLYVMG